MANAAKLAGKTAARILLVGYPGAGKTGSLASLIDAGYKIRMLDFEGNYSPMLQYSNPAMHKNVDIVSFKDKLRNGNKYIEVNGIPTAFASSLNMMDHWTYKEEDGTVVDLGSSKDWGPDTIIVVDSLTAMGKASFRRAQAMLNKTPLNTTQQVWGLAMADQETFIEKLTDPSKRHHVIVLAHLKMVGPKDIQKDDEQVTKDLKEKVMDLVDTRLYPSALGQQLPPVIGGYFPTLLKVERIVKAGKVQRVIRSDTGPELDTKIPAPRDFPAVLPIESGLLTIMDAITPGTKVNLAQSESKE